MLPLVTSQEPKDLFDFTNLQASNIENAFSTGDQINMNIFQTISYFHWAINYFVITIPWVIWCLILLAYNLYMNIFYNDWWEYGNLYLLGNSLYIVV